jgi:hypothetical protein
MLVMETAPERTAVGEGAGVKAAFIPSVPRLALGSKLHS